MVTSTPAFSTGCRRPPVGRGYKPWLSVFIQGPVQVGAKRHRKPGARFTPKRAFYNQTGAAVVMEAWSPN